MTQPTKPQTPVVAKPPVKPPVKKRAGLKKPLNKPLTGGTTYTAASFDVMAPLDTSGDGTTTIRIRFYDAAGNLIPKGAIKPVSKLSPTATQEAIQAIFAVPAVQGELMPAWLLRAATPYVRTVYGATV